MTEPDTTRTLVIEREMPQPPTKVWRALTESTLMDEWLLKNDFQPVVGHKFNLRTAPVGHWDGVVDCEVLIVEPMSCLSYRWNVGKDAANCLKTVVTWTLTPTSGGTLVRMEQSGFAPEQQANYKGAAYGWQKFFGALERVVAELVES